LRQILLLLLALTAAPAFQEGQEPARVGGAIQPPKKLRNVPPEYPEEARKAGLEGVVVLECTIDTEGRVTGVEFLKGPVPLKEPAVKAVKKWRYTPTLLEGRAVPVIMTVTVNFKHSQRVRLDELISSLRHKDEYIREAAAQTLGRLGPRAVEAGPALSKAIHDQSDRVRKAAAEALEAVQGKYR
jgi:TonB family protein